MWANVDKDGYETSQPGFSRYPENVLQHWAQILTWQLSAAEKQPDTVHRALPHVSYSRAPPAMTPPCPQQAVKSVILDLTPSVFIDEETEQQHI